MRSASGCRNSKRTACCHPDEWQSRQPDAAHGVLEDPLFCSTMVILNNPDGQVTAGRSMADAMQAPLRLAKEEHAAAARMIHAVHIDRHRDDAPCLAFHIHLKHHIIIIHHDQQIQGTIDENTSARKYTFVDADIASPPCFRRPTLFFWAPIFLAVAPSPSFRRVGEHCDQAFLLLPEQDDVEVGGDCRIVEQIGPGAKATPRVCSPDARHHHALLRRGVEDDVPHRFRRLLAVLEEQETIAGIRDYA